MDEERYNVHFFFGYILNTCCVQEIVLIIEGIKQTWFLPSSSLKSSRKDS